MFKSLVLSAVFLLIAGFDYPRSNIIYWHASHKLTWNDFRETNRPGNTGAVSSIGIEYKMSVENNIADIVVQSFFNRNDSWVKRGQKHDKGLKHEQGHFDISEIFARKLRKHISEKQFSDSGIDKELSGLYQAYIKQLNAYQDLYDRETDHHRDDLNQLVWDKRIQKELRELQKYSGTNIKFHLK